MNELVSIFKDQEDPHKAYLDAELPALKERGWCDREALYNGNEFRYPDLLDLDQPEENGPSLVI